MSKKFNSGLAIVLPNKKVNMFVIFIIILGIISGSLFLMVLNDTDNTLIIDQITTFINSINTNNIDNIRAFKNALYENLIFIILIWLLGMSIIGIIVDIFLVYIKGFITGFCLSAFFLVYKYKGLILSLIYVVPTTIINLIVTLIIGVYAIIFTIDLWKIVFLKDKNITINKFFKKYLLILLICIGLCLISSITEAYLIPALIKVIIKLFI